MVQCFDQSFPPYHPRCLPTAIIAVHPFHRTRRHRGHTQAGVIQIHLALHGNDAVSFCHSCLQCQQAKMWGHHHSPVLPINVPDRQFSHVHVDLVGPLPGSADGFNYLLTCIDRSTRWLEAVPLWSTLAMAVAEAFVLTWVGSLWRASHINVRPGCAIHFFSVASSLHTSGYCPCHHVTTMS